jgi:hypothetical protein
MNHQHITTFSQLCIGITTKLKVTDENGYKMSGHQLMMFAIEMFPRIQEYVSIYNNVVDLIMRLSPTANTAYHIHLEKDVKRMLQHLTTSQLYIERDYLLQRL